MNRELKHRIFDIPQKILDKINHTLVGLNGQGHSGTKRAEKLLSDKKVKYGQIKRIIHDLQNIDKSVNRLKYDLAGGDDMLEWGKKFLDGERDLISNRKDSKKRADDIAGEGSRKNSHLSKHKKKSSFLPDMSMKNNSNKFSTSLKLFEEIERIKKLM
jgi:chemotaxis receptor (MCP) glutamine deamidase CheD